MADESDGIFLNGISGVTGDYLVRRLGRADAVAWAKAADIEAPRQTSQPYQGLPWGVEPTDLAQAGWGIVFAADTPAEVRAALQPLIVHRRSQIPADRCLEMEYRPGAGLKGWLKSYGMFPGAVTPTKVPYYLMLVGDPQGIPFQFQYLLDIEYAVGRVCFERVDDYRQYAESIVEYETTGTVPSRREVVYWGARHRADRATQLSADHLITPLHEGEPAARQAPIADAVSFRGHCFKAADATRANLQQVFHPGAKGPPSFLFTASHGMGWPLGHEQQRCDQGALLCQDWSGFGSVRREHYLSADDIEGDARLLGLVAFVFACYGAGTPATDGYLAPQADGPLEIAEAPFVAALPQRLLAHPNGGALAVMGHVERAWSYSVKPPGVGAQLQPYRNFIGRVLSGEPVGHATKDFSDKYAVLTAELCSLLEAIKHGQDFDEQALTQNWIERNDAQNYVLLGDPAARVRVDALLKY